MKNLKKIILGIAVCIFSTFIYAYVSSIIKKEKNELLQQESTLTDLLTTQEKEMWEQLALNDIDKNECEKLSEEIAEKQTSNQKDERQLLSKEMLDLIIEVLTSFDINPEDVIICLTDSDSPAMAKDNVLYINEKALATYSVNAQKFIIAHEAQHILHRDHSCRTAALKLIQKKIKGSWQTENPEYPLNDLIYFSEMRADIQAASKNKEFAQGYLDFAQTLINDKDEQFNPGTTHPKATYRLSIANDIYAKINNQTA